MITQLKDGETIEFVWMDPTPGGQNLGRAEFTFCPKIERGILRGVFISRGQQRHKTRTYYAAFPTMAESFQVSDGRTKDYNERHMGPWRIMPCRDHKSVALEFYVKDGMSRIEFRNGSILPTFTFF